ncbi:Neuroblastoma-amplified sequence [Liparis tanakae]|uniref:Neuroblastoma-amplified sequence n=1 Tax=Liparis tanakae TaxID=230148 RepID=A0A4Z2G9A4_9TELE|nr:Neuroblastoma-amplified sequence [Liparis tanakae]
MAPRRRTSVELRGRAGCEKTQIKYCVPLDHSSPPAVADPDPAATSHNAAQIEICIDNEEYGEALSLAQAYNLDSDLVYQRQWRKSTVSIASIQDYLSKICKRSWVLHECAERVPENVDATKELLQYGLKGTDLEALIAIGNRKDGGRFIMPGDLDIDDIPYEDILSGEEELKAKKEAENRKRGELLASVDFSRLTLEQKELCRSRLKLLSYLDRLETYEEILGGPHAAEQKYDAEFFKKFRSQNILISARNYARESNVQALDILFTLDDGGELVLIPWDEQRHRELDWCEAELCRATLDQSVFDDDSFLYEGAPELLRFRTAAPAIELLTDWYQSRAKHIDSGSRQTGRERGEERGPDSEFRWRPVIVLTVPKLRQEAEEPRRRFGLKESADVGQAGETEKDEKEFVGRGIKVCEISQRE